MKEQVVEILAPAGNKDALLAAVRAGADAVYVGGSRFGARAYAANFTEEELLFALDYVHMKERKLYLTVNTLVKQSEIDSMYDFLLPFYRQGLDGVIVQDFGVGTVIRQAFPDLELHASTQMAVTGADGAAFLQGNGYVRVVPAREISLPEIRKIKEKTGLSVECFVHGALCYCYSGQCLLSSMIGGRSGNRGQCAQPCRLPYSVKEGRPSDLMSLKDLCTIDLLPELLDAGIDSFKIEGRMKQPDYVAGAVEIYRKYADLCLAGERPYQVSEEDRRRLLGAYQRRGYTEGYYRQHNGKQMISLKRPKAREYAEGTKDAAGALPEIKEKINGKLIFSPEKHVKLLLESKRCSLEYEGPVPEPAKKQPLDPQRVEKQMRKTGNSAFQFEQLDIQMEGAFFLPMQALNELRRKGLEKLEWEILKAYHRESPGMLLRNPEKVEETPAPESRSAVERQPVLAVLVQTVPQLQAALSIPGVERIYVDSMTGNRPAVRKIMEDSRKNPDRRAPGYYLAMPYIFREETKTKFERDYQEALRDYDGVLIRNLESLKWLQDREYKKPVRSDYNLYACNRRSRDFLIGEGLEAVTASVELNFKELRELGIEGQTLIAYGYQPVMLTANCIKRTTGGCEKRPGYLYITDRYRKKFAVKACCDYCYNIIYNSAPLFLADQAEKILELRPGEVRLDFSTERPEEVIKMAGIYQRAFLNGERVGVPEMEFTRGHTKRGVK